MQLFVVTRWLKKAKNVIVGLKKIAKKIRAVIMLMKRKAVNLSRISNAGNFSDLDFWSKVGQS
jgi:hypothetical protein